MAERKIRVLLVEDDEQTRTVFGIYLPLLGVEVLMTANGERALEEISRFDPDVILLDLLMPDMDGWTFLKRYSGPIPVIVISAYSDMTNLPREPYAMVMKPVDMRDVAKLLKQAAKLVRPDR